MSADSTLVAMGSPEGSLADHSQKAEVVNTTSNITIEDENIDYDADYEQTVRFTFNTVTDFGEDDITVVNAVIVSGSLEETTTGIEYTIRIKAQVTPTAPCITIALRETFKTDNDITDGTVSVNYVYFPDFNLRNALVNYNRTETNYINKVDTNNDGLISCEEASNIVGESGIVFSLQGVAMKDMTGFSAFSNFAGDLRLLYCYYLETLDLTHNPDIAQLYIHGLGSSPMALKHLDVSGLSNLVYLDAYLTSIEALDVSTNLLLDNLNVRDTPLRTLDLSKNSKIRIFRAQRNNNLVSLELSHMSLLGGYSGTLIVNNNEKLKSLSIPSLEGSGINAPYVDIHNNPNLECITFTNNLNTRDTSPGISEDQQALLTTNACVVQFSDDDFKDALVDSSAINTNDDTEISYAEAAAYTGTINVSDADIDDMTGLNAFSNITGLNCSGNDLVGNRLDLFNNPALEYLSCSDNVLTQIDLSGNTLLKELFCDSNRIGDLDLSNNPALEYLVCDNNGIYLKSLNLINGNNENISYFFATGNTNLNCVQVDDVTYSNLNWSTGIDGNTIFASDSDCSALSVNTELINDAIRISPNPVTNTLNIITSSGVELKQAKLYSTLGKELVSTTSSELDASSLPTGMYILKVESTDGKIQTKKIIKK
ncbi:MAG: T9SS type A sorting domain-containing protein [Algibacter sp.]